MNQKALRHEQAFADYVAFGAERTLRKIAEKFKVSEQAVAAWSRKGNWRERIKEIDARTGAKIIAKAEENLSQVKDRQIKITRIIQRKLIDRLQSDEVQPTIGDGLSAMRHELALYGQSGPLPDLHGDPLTEADADRIILEETRRLTAIRARRGG